MAKRVKKDFPNWIVRGYLDRLEDTPYAHAPDPGQKPPDVPIKDMPPAWEQYLDGYNSAAVDLKSGLAKAKQ
jgi:hypothetical protein